MSLLLFLYNEPQLHHASEKLNLFIREYYKNQMLRGTIYSTIGLVSALIMLASIEHYGFFNGFIRSIIFWSYLFLSALACGWFILRPFLKILRLSERLSHKEAARIIGKHFGGVSDKLTNILELNDIDKGNAEIIQASIDQKIQEIELTPFHHAIDWKNIKLWQIPFCANWRRFNICHFWQ